MQPIYLSEELIWESSNPWPKFCLHVGLQDFLKLLAGSYFLVPRRFVDQCDNTDAGESSDQKFRRFGGILLILNQYSAVACVQIHFAYHRQNFCAVPERTAGAACVAVSYRFVPLHEFACYEGTQVRRAQEWRTP